MADIIGTIEGVIVAALKVAVTDRPVEASPEDPRAYSDLPIGENGAILVSYRGSTFNPDGPMNSQIRRVHFDISIIVRDLRTGTGAYQLIETIRAALTGLNVYSGYVLRCISDGFLDVVDHLWLFTATYEAEIIDTTA